MMALTAQQKTEALVRKDIDIDDLVANENNPNSMSDAEFNLLHDNLEKTGLTDPILVRDIGGGKYRIVGGHHRVEAAKLHDFKKVPCTIITDPDFDDDQEKFQVVRMNMIRGKMTPEKFIKLYESLSSKYTEEILKDAFGFAEDAEFKKMIRQITKDLPPELQADFKKASKELKTINDLTSVLNGLFTKYGSTLDYGYMMLDYGGKDSVWVRINSTTLKNLHALGETCRETSRSMDSLLGGIVQLIADGSLADEVAYVVSKTPPVSIPDEAPELPTDEYLEAVGMKK